MRGRRPSLASLAGLAAMLTASLALAPIASAEEVYGQGSAGQPFTISSTSPAGGLQVNGSVDQSLSLAVVALNTFDAGAPAWIGLAAADPRMAVPLKPGDAVGGASGHILVADRIHKFVAELDDTGNAVWLYENGVGGAVLERPFSAQPVTWQGRRCILIADRGEAEAGGVAHPRVIMVDKASKELVWQYGTPQPSAADQLHDPFTATWVSGDEPTVLIADNNGGGNRVIEVRVEDYRAGAASHGFTAGSIVWQYGTTGVSGAGVNQLMHPRSPQRLPDGSTLIADALAQRVLVVDTSDYRAGAADNGFTEASILWEYKSEFLHDPNMATRLADGTTLIADCGDKDDRVSGKILWITPEKTVAATLDLLTFDPPSGTDVSEPRSALVDPVDGSLVTSDSTRSRVLRIGNVASATVESLPLDCGKPAMLKSFHRLSWTGWVGPEQSIVMWYRIDGEDWRRCSGRKFDFPKGTAGKRISYRVVLTSANRWSTPVFDGFTLMYDRATQGPIGGGGGDKPGGEANSGSDDGVYTYPGLSGTGTSGGGTGAGSSGYGSGSGTSGSGTGGATSRSPTLSASSDVAAPPPSAATGPEQSVSGVQVQGLEGVSGIALRAAPGAHVKDESGDAGEPLSVAAIVAVSIGALAGVLLPWPFFAARLRDIGGFDHIRPRRYPPFRSLR